MKQILNEFASNTSGHGWGMVGRTTNAFAKTLWIVITVLSTIAAIIWVATIVGRYIKYETKDKVELKADVDIVFPSVTVCPLHGYSNDKMNDPKLVSSFLLQSRLIMAVYPRIKNITQMTNETGDVILELVHRIRSHRGYYENMGKRETSALSHEIINLVPYCLYQESRCTPEHFQKLVHHEYMNCYTFNGKDINLTKPVISSSGAQNGLSLTLFLEQKDDTYAPYDRSRAITATAGARVIIHEKGTLPDPDNDGFNVEPGHLVNVALSVNKRELMKPPWGECADHNTLQSTDFKYSRNACKSKCLEKMIQQECGCKKDLLPVELETRDDDIQACGKFNREEWLKVPNITEANITILKEDVTRFKCGEKEYAWSKISEDIPGCKCEYNCSYLTYDIETSQSLWPMKGSEMDFFCGGLAYEDTYVGSTIYDEFHDKIGMYCLNYFGQYANISKLWGDKLRDNFLRVNVYLKEPVTKYTVEEVDFTVITMVSEIGGVLGIFIGVSIITILEVFVLCNGIVYTLYRAKKTSSNIDVTEVIVTQSKNSENLSDPKTKYYQSKLSK
ncbi:unnamed protein product [Owenia fusiformis]|uniref:Uncharacterized protein n=1 Tax=Owenia fusiformis TaxID=6347 RepID=A0A8J1XK44_OWEFU|nr:unnamed protein product [Owenia fusiformis]